MVSAGSDTGYRRAHEESEIAAVAERNGKTAKRQNEALSPVNIRRVGLLSRQNTTSKIGIILEHSDWLIVVRLFCAVGFAPAAHFLCLFMFDLS